MIISETAVRKRTSVVVMAMVIIVFGIISYLSLPREAAPDITIPYVFIMTRYPGVAPEDIEKSITIPCSATPSSVIILPDSIISIA